MTIEKYITPFIESQFPLFYQEEGPYFIEFVKAYYSWLESQGEILNQSRSLMEYRDLDTTLDNFIIYFKNKYINSLPENVLADKKLLIKYILDLYRSKGSDQSYALLFKLLFNEDIELYVPGKNLFTLSDGEWTVPRYIEVTDNPNLVNLIGNKIYSSSTLSTAVVDNYFTKIVNNKFINVLVLNSIQGNFKFGEKILCETINEITTENAPVIIGSLSSVSITDGGLNYNVGDVLNIKNSGIGGLGRVVATTSKNGQVEFTLYDGGSGFSLDSIVNVTGEIHNLISATNTDPVRVETSTPHNLSNSDTLRIDYVLGMEDLNVPSYSYYANVVNSTAVDLYSNYELTSTVDGTGFGTYISNTGYLYLNTGGTGASFQIGSIVNKEIYRINTDNISDYFLEKMDSPVSGYNISYSSLTGTINSGDQIEMANVDVLSLDVEVLNASILANGEILSNTSLGIANLTVVNSDDTYIQLKGSDITNANLQVGTILISDVSNTYIHVNNIFPIETINASATAFFVNSSVVSVNNQIGYFLFGEPLLDTVSGASATIDSVERLTDYGFPAVAIPDIENMDTYVGNALTIVDKEVGTIASLKNINSGEGYATDPVVTIIEPLIYELREIGSNGGYKGFNANVVAAAGYAEGIVTAIEVIDSGYGYQRDTEVSLTTANNQYAVKGISVVDLGGKSKGYWKNNKSFLSDTIYLQDSYYYQKFSYEILATRMLETYETYIKNLIHPSGMKLFGKFFIKSEFGNENSTIADSSFEQS